MRFGRHAPAWCSAVTTSTVPSICAHIAVSEHRRKRHSTVRCLSAQPDCRGRGSPSLSDFVVSLSTHGRYFRITSHRQYFESPAVNTIMASATVYDHKKATHRLQEKAENAKPRQPARHVRASSTASNASTSSAPNNASDADLPDVHTQAPEVITSSFPLHSADEDEDSEANPKRADKNRKMYKLRRHKGDTIIELVCLEQVGCLCRCTLCRCIESAAAHAMTSMYLFLRSLFPATLSLSFFTGPTLAPMW